MATVDIRDVRKSYGPLEVLHGVDLSVADGEFVSLIGASGCGKSTLLRMIAGLEDVTSGEIALGGRIVNDVEPKDRDIAMVFQNYALYPHLTVAENMGFSLKLRNVSGSDTRKAVEETAELLGLSPFLDRLPRALSGGQRQRVAMGRAIVRRPRVFLFDEPLSNLDAQLRVQMRVEIKSLQRRLGTTAIYVTHDQMEAMTMSDRIVVMNGGRVEQTGAPLDVYDRPANLFVATFIGSPAMNLLPGTLVRSEGRAEVRCAETTIPLARDVDVAEGTAVVCGIRPEHVDLAPTGGDRSPFLVDLVEPTGSESHLYGRLAGVASVVAVGGRSPVRQGERVDVGIRAGGLHIFDAASGRRLEEMPQTPSRVPSISSSTRNGRTMVQDGKRTEIFGMTPAELAALGAFATAREIAQQPELWEALADLLHARSGEIAEFLEEPFARNDLLVVFTGAGTSAFAGGVVAAEAMAAKGREMRRIATTDIVEGWSRHLDPRRPTLVVSFARSGDSPESVAALEIVDRRCETVWHLILTCNPAGALARAGTGPNRFTLVMPEGSCDQGFAMTGSFSCMALAALAIFASDTPAAAAGGVRRLVEPCRTILSAWPEAADLAARRHDRVVFLGSGALADAASECALKLMELTDGEVPAMACSPLAFRHGPKTIVNGRGTLVVQLVSGDPSVQPYGLDMLTELASDGRADRFVLVPAYRRPDVEAPAVAAGLAECRTDDGALGVLYVVFGQMLALFSSLERGFRTDTPSRSGEVNRVVRNVAIHG